MVILGHSSFQKHCQAEPEANAEKSKSFAEETFINDATFVLTSSTRMNKGPNAVISKILRSNPCTNYSEWKWARNYLVSNLGPSLLSFDEAELTSLFASIENELRELLQSQNPEDQLFGLLEISVLHFFRRSYDQIKKIFPKINNLTANSNRDVSHASTSCLRFLADESSDNYTFLREALDSAKNYLAPAQRDRYIYNALSILQKVGRFLPTDVFGVTFQKFPEIWAAACSNDLALRRVAVKVIEIHLRNVPTNLQVSFAESLFVDCNAKFSSKTTGAYHGAVLVCQSIYKLFPNIFTDQKIVSLIDKLLTIATTPSHEFAMDIFTFIYRLLQFKPLGFTNEKLSALIKALSAQILSKIGLPDLFFRLAKFLKFFHSEKHVKFPIETVIAMIQKMVTTPMYNQYQEKVFQVLYYVFDLYPTANVPVSIFLNCPPCKSYVSALRLRTSYLREIREYLMEQFGKGIQQNKSTQEEQEVSILMVKEFEKLLFDDLDPLFEMLRPFTYSCYENIRFLMTDTLPIFNIQDANDELVRLAIMDPSKRVRLRSLQKIKPAMLIRKPDAITQLLADPSYRVRRNAIPLIAESATIHSIYTVPTIVVFVNDYFASNIAHNNPSKSAKTCSILPAIANYFVQFSPPFIPIVTWICLLFLSHDKPIHEIDPTIDMGSFKPIDIRRVVHRDFTADGFSTSSRIQEKDFNLTRVYQVENSKWLEKRDSYLFEALGKLAPHLLSYLQQLIPVFIQCFAEKHSELVYLAALNALTSTVVASEAKINFMFIFPDLLPTLLQLLGSEHITQAVAVAILKLTGTIGASKSVVVDATKDEQTVEHMFAVKNPSFFTTFVLKSLVEMLKDPSPSVFDAITCIFVKDTEYALPFLGQVIQGFVKAIEHDTDKKTLFSQLELIAVNCTINLIPFLTILKDMLRTNFNNIHCVRVAVVLSYHLKSEFIEVANVLYPIALHLLDNESNEYYKVMLKFIDFAILFQHQSIELFIEAAEKKIQTKIDDEVRLAFMLKAISMLVQLRPFYVYAARISRFAFTLLQLKPLNEVNQLLYNLILFGHLSIDVVERYTQMYNCNIQHLSELRNAFLKGEPVIDDFSFIKKLSPQLVSEHLNATILPMNAQIQNVFKNIQRPVFNNARQWLEDLCIQVVQNSPSIAIRSCVQVISQSQAFRNELFPIAFLSCWKVTDASDRMAFSNIVKMIIQNFEQIDPQVIYLAELVDRVGIPLSIPDNVLAKACRSTALSLYFLQRHLRDNPGDKDTIEQLLELNSKMGRIDSARGLLASVSNKLNQEDQGKWSEQLGEWEKALEIYENKTPKDMNELLQCYAHLELWDKIYQLSPEFEKMDKKQQEQNALWFAWADYHAKDQNKVRYYMKFLPKDDNLNVILFKAIYLVSSSESYPAASKFIETGFKKLTENRAMFSGSDANEASKRMVFAQHLIELQEALNMKKKSSTDIPNIWQNRLRNFSHESDAWMKLIEIRSLVLSPADHSESYLKMLSVLRKERRWKLIDVYCKRFFSTTSSPSIMMARLKILWGRGMKHKAVSLICNFNQMLRSQDVEEFTIAYNKMSKEELAFTYEALNIDLEKQDSSMEKRFNYLKKFTQNGRDLIMARYFRTQASWQYKLYKSKTSSASILIDISKTFEESLKLVSNDYRTWAGWAYASSRALSHFSDLRSKFSINAISGFLNATQLRPSESLEFLCQMFSIFFRYGEEVALPEVLRNDIISLPASIIIQIIPQIVVHITHNNPNVRDVVRNIIIHFGNDHFEAVVYSLNVLSLINDTSKADIARDVIQVLANKHPATFNDVRLLIDGMHRSAVSWTEQWLTALDTASRAQQMNDRDSVISIVGNLYKLIETPRCEMDRNFLRSFGTKLQRTKVLFEKYKNGDQNVVRSMWDGFRSLFAELEDKIKKTESIQLSKVTEELSEKRGYALAVPGTYEVESPSPQLDFIEHTLQVLNSQQHPRCVYMMDNTGTRWKFLLKGNEDLRLDQRIMQFFNLINSLLITNRNTADLEVSILKYAIVPFAPNAGLISWVTGADTFQQLVIDYRSHREIRQSIELEISQQFVGGIFNSLNSLQRYEVFSSVAQQTPANELREMLWLRSPEPSSWLQRNRNFTVSTALMSMAGYTIGLGDRHPSNIMVQRHTGRVIHIDFGDSFEVAMNRPVFSERVPFRMTRMIVNALDGSCVDGLFRRCCEDVLWVLRENQSSVIAQLEVFVHEPIFYGREIRPNDKAQKGILERVASKLSGTDPIPYDQPDIELDVAQQVDTLINISADPKEYVRHYIGWCPFW